MYKRIFVILALAFALFVTECWGAAKTSSRPAVLSAAQTGCGGIEQPPCPPPSITNTFSPGTPRGVYDFTTTGDGILVVQFDTVLAPGFSLTVTVNHSLDPLDPNVFPTGTVCVKYSTNFGPCEQYDFTGNAGGPNGVPVKKTDYKGLITLTLSYDTFQTVHNPAFGHAPGLNATAVYSEDILTSYSTFPPCPGEVSCQNFTDPTMGGKTPNLSSVAALDEPGKTDCFVWVSPTQSQIFTVGQEIEVEFKLFDNTACTGNPIRDKDARLSLARVDNGVLVFVPVGKDEGGKHFHFDHEEGVNEREVDTKGLQPGIYIISVFSDEFSPQTRIVVIQ